VDWNIQRVLISEHYNETLREINEYWTVNDVQEAHTVLDLIDSQNREKQRELDQKMKRK
jgi:hypothetical protein